MNWRTLLPGQHCRALLHYSFRPVSSTGTRLQRPTQVMQVETEFQRNSNRATIPVSSRNVQRIRLRAKRKSHLLNWHREVRLKSTSAIDAEQRVLQSQAEKDRSPHNTAILQTKSESLELYSLSAADRSKVTSAIQFHEKKGSIATFHSVIGALCLGIV